MNFITLLKTRFFLLILFSLPLSDRIGNMVSDLFGKNETIGWKFDILNTPIDLITGFLPFLYVTCYLIMSLLKISTDLLFSKIHLIAVIISSILFSFTDINFKIVFLAAGVSLILFIVNVYVSLRNRKSVMQ
ncbi:MAG: hypothetical protein ACI849_001209 [Patiriisocius sp.]|jgi:hypothetical protein